MNQKNDEPELKQWVSTYGILTAERILMRFKLNLDHNELIAAVKNPRSVYYQLLRVPLKNIFNGIILQQAYDYQVYAQKLFVDYFLSGAADLPTEAPGQSMRSDLEDERKTLMELNNEFNELLVSHQQLIAESQIRLIELSGEMKQSLQNAAKKIHNLLDKHQINPSNMQVEKALRDAIVAYKDDEQAMYASGSSFWLLLEKNLNIKIGESLFSPFENLMTNLSEKRKEIEYVLSGFLERSSEIMAGIKSFRRQFYEMILSVKNLIRLLPDYYADERKDRKNLESLQFDTSIGEEQ